MAKKATTKTSKPVQSGLFPFLNWILQKKGKLVIDPTLPSSFMLNRWLSMSDPLVAKIVNATSNKWIHNTEIAKDNISLGKFFHTIIPKTFSRLEYLKKGTKETTDEDLNIVANSMECSEREVKIYNQLLDELK